MTEHPPQSFFHKLEAQIKMRPKWQFGLEYALLGLAIILVAIGLVFFTSLVTYLWRTAHLSDLPGFGPGGTSIFIRSFPWWEATAVLVGAVAFFYLVRRHTSIYRWPLAAIIGVFLIAFISAAALADTSHVHDRLANRAFNTSFPVVGPLYRFHESLEHGLITTGTISKVSGNTLTVRAVDGDLQVTITDDTRLDASWKPTIGEQIVVIGHRRGTKITAEAIRSFNELPMHSPFFRYQMPGRMMPDPDDETNPAPSPYY